MDQILAAAVAILFLLATLIWPKLAGDWLTWGNTTSYKIGWLSRLGLGLVYGGLAVVLFIADGAQAEWWWAYLVMIAGIGLTIGGYRRDSRTSVELDGDFARGR
jgi:hypothetical protein